jgi:CPA1 family monovalent cation:H+ antiporter
VEVTGIVLLSLLAVVVSGLLARVSRLPLPLVQMALGAAVAGFGLTSVKLEPELFFLLFLPPLLFLDGWRIPNDALRRDAATILKLAFGLVLFTVLGMGFFIHWLLPTMPLAVAFALAAAISPTDPVSVSALAARTPIPPRVMHVLRGEALLNDASGLVCMRFAVAAALTGVFSWSAALLSFLWLALAGVAVGVGVTWLVARAATWSSERWGQDEDGGAQILVTLLLPFGVYLLAEQVHGSGILAAVAAGVTMSTAEHWPWRPGTRLHRTAVWDLLQFAATGSIFVLLGEQLPALVRAAPQTALEAAHPSVVWLVLDALVITLALVALRFAWVWVSLKVRLMGGRVPGDGAPGADAPRVLVASLAGVRGAVTMAAVLTLPLAGAGGAPFPARDLAIQLAAGVIVLSLLLASAALPRALRRLQPPDDQAQRDAEDAARRSAATAAVAAVRAALPDAPPAETAAIAERVMAPYLHRIGHLAEGRAAAPRAAREDVERRLHLMALRAERAELLRYGRAHGVGEGALRRLVHEVDLMETRHGG